MKEILKKYNIRQSDLDMGIEIIIKNSVSKFGSAPNVIIAIVDLLRNGDIENEVKRKSKKDSEDDQRSELRRGIFGKVLQRDTGSEKDAEHINADNADPKS